MEMGFWRWDLRMSIYTESFPDDSDVQPQLDAFRDNSL